MYVGCDACKNLKHGNWFVALPDGSVTRCSSICTKPDCEPGLNTHYRPVI